MSNNSRYEVDLSGRNPREKKQDVRDIPGAEGRRTASEARFTGEAHRDLYNSLGQLKPNIADNSRGPHKVDLTGRNPREKKQDVSDIPGAEERRTSSRAPRTHGGKRRKGRKSRKVRKSKTKRKKGRKSRKARKTGKNKRRKRGGRRTRRRRNH